MCDSIIYEKHYPKANAAENEIESTSRAEPLSFEQIMGKICKDVVYIPLPEKQAAAKEFLKSAIALSNRYEIDIKVCRYFEHIEVKYFFDYAMNIRFLKDIIAQSDDISLFKDDEGFNLSIALDYYTHAVYRKDRRVIP